ncbi:Smr/MutS family protein [soil metagenome]
MSTDRDRSGSKAPVSKAPKGLTSDDRRLWARVTGSVTPPKARKPLRMTPGAVEPPDSTADASSAAPTRRSGPKPSPAGIAKAELPSVLAMPTMKPQAKRLPPEALEPRRQRRLSREREPIEARFDLHGFGRFEAEDQLRAFLTSAQARGLRAVLVITGQGRLGGGVIRASVHEWLQSAALRGVVSGFAISHRRHGGDGAIYVTLKRR